MYKQILYIIIVYYYFIIITILLHTYILSLRHMIKQWTIIHYLYKSIYKLYIINLSLLLYYFRIIFWVKLFIVKR